MPGGLSIYSGPIFLTALSRFEFFANPIRMQRDLLGDAAESILPTLTLPNVNQ